MTNAACLSRPFAVAVGDHESVLIRPDELPAVVNGVRLERDGDVLRVVNLTGRGVSVRITKAER